MSRLALVFLLAACSAGVVPEHPALPVSLAALVGRPGYLYVSNHAAGRLDVYAGDSGALERSVTLGDVRGVAVDSAGSVYVADGASGVVILGPGGAGVRGTLSGARAQDVAVDASGSAWVTDRSGRILQYRNGRIVRRIPTWLGDSPRGIAVDSRGDVFYSVSGMNDAWPPDMNCLAIGQVREIRDGVDSFVNVPIEQPQGLAVDAAGNLYVADLCLSNVWMRPAGASAGHYLSGSFANPAYLSASKDGLVVSSADFAGTGYVDGPGFHLLAPGVIGAAVSP